MKIIIKWKVEEETLSVRNYYRDFFLKEKSPFHKKN